MNLINIPDCLTINGKKLTKTHRNLLAKLQKDYGFDVPDRFAALSEAGALKVKNPVSGAPSNNLNPLVAALAIFVLDAYQNYSLFGRMSYNGKALSIQAFDNAKYLILHLDNSAYYDLID